MSSMLNHLQINVAGANLPFYKDLFAQLKWQLIHDSPDMLGLLDENGASLWFAAKQGGSAADYDGIGVNHIALGVSDQSAVDEMVSYLKERNIASLFETPRHRPEFAASEDQTYYQVMFESPDKLLFEVVYMGPKS
jgi:Bacteriophytochrome (light-regulated signal transduction histidine kinase)